MSLSQPLLLGLGLVLAAGLGVAVVVLTRRRSAALLAAGISLGIRPSRSLGVWFSLAGVLVLARGTALEVAPSYPDHEFRSLVEALQRDLRPDDRLLVDTYGTYPLAAYGRRAAADLVALSARADVGDVILLGAHDESLGEVAAFEELVGSHGGLGGWQNTAFVLHPSGWHVPSDALTGVGLHRLLVRRLLQRQQPDLRAVAVRDVQIVLGSDRS